MLNLNLALDQAKDNIASHLQKNIAQVRKEVRNVVLNNDVDGKSALIEIHFNNIINKIKKCNALLEREIDDEIKLLKFYVNSIEMERVALETLLKSYNFDGFWRGNWDIDQDAKNYGWSNCHVASDDSHGMILRVNHPVGSGAMELVPGKAGGLFFRNKFKEKYESIRLNFHVRFKEDFRFSKGGTLPGLYGNDFVSRFGWAANGTGELCLDIRHTETIYKGGSWKFVPGKWLAVSQEITFNNPSRSDGAIKVFVDGNEVISVPNICLRTRPDEHVGGIAFINHYGDMTDLASLAPEEFYIDFSKFDICGIVS